MATNDHESLLMTDKEAVLSRISAVKAGYLKDDYVQYFAKKKVKRSPIINRGTFARTAVVDQMMRQFLDSFNAKEDRVVQILNLGAGSDTRYFQFKNQGYQWKGYWEIDFAENTAKKALTIQKQPILKALMTNKNLCTIELSQGASCLNTTDYHLIPGDLRQWSTLIWPALEETGFNTLDPTYIIAECLLIYLEPDKADQIISNLGTQMQKGIFISYEQMNPDDSFGQVMLRNLQQTGIELKGIHDYPTLLSQRERFLNYKWTHVEVFDMNEAFHKFVPSSELDRISKLEPLDEFEEWTLLQNHYGIVIAKKGIHTLEMSKDYVKSLKQ